MKNKYIKIILLAVLVVIVLAVFALPNPRDFLADSETDKATDQAEQVTSTIQVNLSIDGEPGKDLDIASGSNHCDLLNRALEMQIIDSLKMEFNDQYQTYGIYKINDIGKENEVWWVFTINGESAPAGCDGVTVNEGDQVVWEYLGD